MEHVNFRPWIGNNYNTTGYEGKKILVLGESHYCGSELGEGNRCFPLCKRENMLSDCFSQTEDVVKSYLNNYSGEPFQRTFVCFERAVTGKELTQKEREDFWQSVMFYNFIQYSQSGPRIPPQPDHWAKSELAFKEILEQYMPDYIIVWGVRLYKGLPDWNGAGSKLFINEHDSTDIWTYTINGKSIPAIKVHHPSSPSGKSWSYWHEFYKKFLNEY